MQPDNKIIIAIDGFSSCGKSTVAKSLAKELGYIFIDSGAMYRAIAHYFILHHIPLDQTAEDRATTLKAIVLEFKNINGENVIFLNGKSVDTEIRSKAINNIVSEVAAMGEVREKLKLQQQEMGRQKGIVMDGRDIGTVIFPNAELKVFVTADIEIRTARRFAELQAKGIETTLEEVKINLLKRDRIDSSRAIAPLKKAENAFVLNTSHLSKEEQLETIKEKVASILSN